MKVPGPGTYVLPSEFGIYEVKELGKSQSSANVKNNEQSYAGESANKEEPQGEQGESGEAQNNEDH